MVGRDLSRLCEVTAQVCAETRDRGPADRQPCARFVPAPTAGHPGGNVDTDGETIDGSVDQADSLVARPRGRPLGPPSPGRWRGGEQAAADESLGCRGLLGAP